MWKNHAENFHEKLVPDLLLILIINPKQPLHARNYFKRQLLKSLKNVKFIFSFEPILFDGQNHEKEKRPGTSDQFLFWLQK